jgi:hypothetical protein
MAKLAPYLSIFVNQKLGNDDAPKVTAQWRKELRGLKKVALAAKAAQPYACCSQPGCQKQALWLAWNELEKIGKVNL